MRELTKQQKKVLNDIMRGNEDLVNPNGMKADNPIRSAEDLPDEIWDKLEELNNTEVLYQNVNAFIDEWRWQQIE